MPEDDKESMPDQYKTVSLEEFVEYSKSMFAYWTEDDFASVISSMAQEWIERRLSGSAYLQKEMMIQ